MEKRKVKIGEIAERFFFFLKRCDEAERGWVHRLLRFAKYILAFSAILSRSSGND